MVQEVTPTESKKASKARTTELEKIVVSAIPLRLGADALVKPVEVLAGSALDDVRATNIGMTLGSLPGVQSTWSGPGAGRPVIRGQEGTRVAVLLDGLNAGDVSGIGQGHATAVEPFLAERIELLKGPATLLYGSGAIGGVVNVVDGRIPETPPTSPLSGRGEMRYDSALNGGTAAARIDAGSGAYAVHADLMHRDNGDVSIPQGRIANSYSRSENGSLGAGWLGSKGFVGIAAAQLESDYGNPGVPGNAALGQPPLTVRLRQNRYTMSAGLDKPWPAVERLRMDYAHVDYSHTGYLGQVPGNTFDYASNEVRLTANHAPVSEWHGAVGVQGVNRMFAARSARPLVPPAVTRTLGIFLLEQREFGAWLVEAGARSEHQTTTPRNALRRVFDPLSLALGARYQISPQWHVSANMDRSQRAPTEEELYANGVHAAGYERGSNTLNVETARQTELGLHWQGAHVELKVALWHNQFSDYLFLADTNQKVNNLALRQWVQADAVFRGYELETRWHLQRAPGRKMDLRLYADAVRARLASGGNVPRMPATRVGLEWTQSRDGWRARAGMVRYFKQAAVATLEQPTAGFTLFNASMAYTLASNSRSEWEAYLEGSNLTNQTARLATSLIKAQAPLPGRGVTLGVRAYF